MCVSVSVCECECVCECGWCWGYLKALSYCQPPTERETCTAARLPYMASRVAANTIHMKK